MDTVHATNSLGDDVEVETGAYAACLRLKAGLAQEGVRINLDSACRSADDQQGIINSVTEMYGEDHARRYVAQPGCSEHQTGLALDLYLNIDGRDVCLHEEMEQYPEVWEKVHAKLADYGFILRFLEGKEEMTGYSYEPWHIRWVKDPSAAQEIMARGITLEEYLGCLPQSDVYD